MKRALLFAVFVAVIVPPDFHPAHAAEPLSDAGRGDAPFVAVIPQHVAERAGISLEQQREVSRLTTTSNGELEALRKRHRSAQQALDLLLQKREPPEAAVMTQVERVGAAETAIKKNRVALLLHVRRVLGPQLFSRLGQELELEKQRVAERLPALPVPQPVFGTQTGDQAGRVGDPIQVERVSGTLRSSPR